MTRLLKLLPLLAVLLVAAVACGSSSSSSSLDDDDVAVVNGQHITKDQLDAQISLLVAAAKGSGQTVPKAGTTAYKQQVISPSLQQLVLNAQVEQIAKDMHITASDSDVSKEIDTIVKTQYGGDKSKFDAAVKKYGYTDDSLNAVLRYGILEKKIGAAATKEVSMSPADLKAAYKKDAKSFGDARNVHYMLWKNKASADAALAKMNSGTSEKAASTGSIDADTTHGTTGFVAASGPGLMDANFQRAAFSLAEGKWGTPIPADATYAKTNLAGQCKPTCYFLINPDGAVAKAGSDDAYTLLKDQITAKLDPTTTTQAKAKAKIAALVAALTKKTTYAKGYAPPAASTAPTTTSSTDTTQ